MDWMKLLYDVLNCCIIPFLGIATVYLIKWLSAKEKETLDKIDNATAEKYVSMLFDTIRDCVSATTQTYVEKLKKDNAFTAEAQKIAF